MLRLVLIFILIIFKQTSFSQAWKDSLRSARIAYQNGAYEKALSSYISTEKIAPKNIDFSAEKAQAAYKASKHDVSEKIYIKKTQNTASSNQQKARYYHNLGNTKFKQEKFKEAVEAYKQALRNNPNDAETRYNLSQALKKQQQSQKKQEQNKDKQNQSNKQNKEQDSNSSKNEENKKNKSSDDEQQQQSSSSLTDRQNEKMLNDLVKQEMNTKRKMNAKRTKSSTSKSGKDW